MFMYKHFLCLKLECNLSIIITDIVVCDWHMYELTGYAYIKKDSHINQPFNQQLISNVTSLSV